METKTFTTADSMNKFQDVDYITDDDVYANLTPFVKKRVDVLRELQAEHNKLEASFFEELTTLEAKYQKLYEPLYTKRYEIVNGLVEVEGNEKGTVEKKEEDEEEEGVPEFWLTALKTNEELAKEISERDEDALAYLKDIKYTRNIEPKGWKLEFSFDSNPYFSNTVLTKTYHMADEHEPLLRRAIGTEIEWFPGQCLTENIPPRKKPRKETTDGKPLTETEDSVSFFGFFNPPEIPEDDKGLSDDSVDELQSLMEIDYEIASIIREEIIPRAVYWYTGEAIPGNELDLDDDDNITILSDGTEVEAEDDDDDIEAKNEAVDVGGQSGQRPPESEHQ